MLCFQPLIKEICMKLSNKQKQYLKGLAHSLKPVVLLGQNGLTEGVLAEIENALGHHELIKIKVATDDRETKQLIIDTIVRETEALNITKIGHIVVLFRPSENKKIELPRK
jgi:RNA-binding protein